MLHVYETREGHRLTKSEVAELQREICKQNDGKTPKNSFVAKVQAAADRNINLTSDTTDPIITRHFTKDGTRKITKGLATKVISTVASNNKGVVKKGSFASRLQSAADRNEIQPDSDEALLVMMDTKGPHPITKEYARELQRSESLQNQGKTLKGSEASLAQSAADKLAMLQLKALETDAYHQLHQQHYKHHKKHTKEEKIARSRSSDIVSEDEEEDLTDPNRVNTRITAEAPPLAKDVGESRPTHK